MKITNWRKKLAITLAGCGMLSPGAAALAVNFNVNILANPGFENVDPTVTGDYSAPKIKDWLGGPAFAYSHDGSLGVPDYANGGPLAGGGHWYFTANNNPNSPTGDWREPNLIYQDIDVSTGDSAAAIAAGKGRVDMSAFMSTYSTDLDYGVVQVDFRDATGESRGFAQITDSDKGSSNTWNLNSGAAPIHPGTTTLRVSIFGSPQTYGADGYMDNIDVRVNQAANVQFLALEVNTVTGQMVLKNESGGPFKIDYYEITSAGNRLSTAGWNSLKDQNLAGFPAGNGTGNGWEEAGGSSAGALSESYLTGNSTAANGSSINFGNAFLTGGAQDIVFRYGQVTPPPALSADFNSDGEVDGADLLIWQRNLGLTDEGTPPPKSAGNANGDSSVNAADLELFSEQFGTGVGTSQLIRGVVRYVTPVAGAVPEPGSVLLVGIGIGVLAGTRRRR